MRGIKFRAWGKSTKKMHYEGFAVNPDGTTKTWGLFEHLEIMQYTGLKDKQGKEIYEGDMVIVQDTYKDRILDDGTGPIEPCDHITPVVFEGSGFGVTIKHGADIFHSGFWSFIDIERETTQDTFEVIGNIYENPELLATSSKERSNEK